MHSNRMRTDRRTDHILQCSAHPLDADPPDADPPGGRPPGGRLPWMQILWSCDSYLQNRGGLS